MNTLTQPESQITLQTEELIEVLVDVIIAAKTQKSVILALQDVARASLDDKFSTKEIASFVKAVKPTVELKGDARREAIISLLTETFETILNNRKGITMDTNTENTVTPITPETFVRTSGNVIDIILEPIRSDDEKRLGLKVAVNAATSTAISLAMMLARQSRNSVPTEPTSEARNIQDIETEPRPAETEIDSMEPDMTIKAQFECAMELRNGLILEYSPLIRSEYGVVEKYDVLLSPEMFLEFRIKMASVVNIDAIKRGAEQFGETEALVREIMQKDAKEQQDRLNDIKDETLDLIHAYKGECGDQPSIVFDKLPLDTRDRMTDRIAEKVNAEYKRLFPIALRTGDLEISSQMVVYKALYQAIKKIEPQ